MRLFLALPLEDSAREYLRGILASCRKAQPSLKWVGPENLHITLLFFGEVEPQRVPLLMQTLETLQRPLIEPFSLRFQNYGVFPPAGNPRVLYTGITRGMESLQALYGFCASSLRGFYRPENGRSYTPHLTLARVRFGNEPPRGFLETFPPCTQESRVDRLVLYRSVTRPEGAQYHEEWVRFLP
ncbi:MAG: RNA 2',3'-cyclic phosphodiesterase [Spirochaetales bacterium]|nr:RNA 2',3'-cyclic phosphodiesterase [Spirochaetales bacterium]